METDFITECIIGDAIQVHRELGPGLLESAYEACLRALLAKRRFRVERQVPMPLIFQGERMDCAYRLDLLIERQVVVEVKTVTHIEPVHVAQMLTYLKLSQCEVGLILNFNVTRLTDGLKRVVRSKAHHPPRTPSLSVFLGD